MREWKWMLSVSYRHGLKWCSVKLNASEILAVSSGRIHFQFNCRRDGDGPGGDRDARHGLITVLSQRPFYNLTKHLLVFLKMADALTVCFSALIYVKLMFWLLWPRPMGSKPWRRNSIACPGNPALKHALSLTEQQVLSSRQVASCLLCEPPSLNRIRPRPLSPTIHQQAKRANQRA